MAGGPFPPAIRTAPERETPRRRHVPDHDLHRPRRHPRLPHARGPRWRPMSGITVSRLHHEAGDLFFTDEAGKEVYLAGSHTWTSVQDVDHQPFGWGAFVSLLKQTGANFTRLWETDSVNDHGTMTPTPFLQMADGRFDLTRFNPEYFSTLRARVQELGENGIYASVMMFNGWSVHQSDTWPESPWRSGNNVNGIAGTQDSVMGLSDPRITALQDAYVRKVVAAVGDLPNVLWEVCNESVNTDAGWAWQEHMFGVIRAADGGRHPAGVTAAGWWTGPRWEMADRLAHTGADWTAPDGLDYGLNGSVAPAATGGQVSIVDTDHIWGVGGESVGWVWETFTRGHNVLQMDNLLGTGIEGVSTAWVPYGSQAAEFAGREGIRQTRLAAEMVDLTDVREAGRLSSTGFALADPHDGAFIVYAPNGGGFTVDLSGAAGLTMEVHWLRLSTGAVLDGGTVPGGAAAQRMQAPVSGAVALVLTPHDGGSGTGTGGGGSTVGGGTTDHAPVSLSAGSGPDMLVLEVSQDWFQGDATYTVSVDGVQVGGLFAASALHSSGQHDTLTLKGSWGAGSHMVTVEHTNDLWVPGAGDRNLYVSGATYNGTHSEALGSQWFGGSFTVTSGGGTGGLPVPGPGGQFLGGTAGKDLLVGGGGADVIQGMAGNDRMAGRGAADALVLAEGDGHDRIGGFTPGVDKLVFTGGLDASDVWTRQATHGTKTGLDVHYGAAGDVVFLIGVSAIAASDMAFA